MKKSKVAIGNSSYTERTNGRKRKSSLVELNVKDGTKSKVNSNYSLMESGGKDEDVEKY